MMRDTKAHGWFVQNSSDVPMRAVRIAAVALVVGFVMATGAARAQEDAEDGKSFQEKIMDGIKAQIKGTNMDNRGIEYRERSPLVVPPRLDLPPPATAAVEANAPPNWPKDPDEARRKAAIARRKKENSDSLIANRINTPESYASRNAAQAGAPGEVAPPGQGNTSGNSSLLNLSKLGLDGSSLFGGNKTEVAPFNGEPARESLTQPPSGYQTPSPNFAYGTGSKESLNKENAAQGKPADQTKSGE